MKLHYPGRLPQPSLLLLLGSLLLSAPALAQTRTTVTGQLAGASGAPIDYATVTLHRATDSTVVKSEFSDEKGTFRFEQTPTGAYLVSASQVGFVRTWSKVFTAGAETVALPVLTLAASGATTLKEVQVVGQKPLFEREADRTIVNVEGSTLAAGNTSLDVLSRSPGVTVDGNDNIGLRGRQGVLVLIDGKRQPMTGAELADYLRALPAEQLKSIELITNPPAKYEAQGSAGIIAINLKKDQRVGTNGSLSSSYGHGRFGRFTSGLTLNHRTKKTNTFGSYTFADRRNYGALTIHRDFYRPTDQGKAYDGSTDQDNYGAGHNVSHTWKAGLDYTLSEQTVVGVTVNGLQNRNTQRGSNLTTRTDAAGNALRGYNSTNNREATFPNVAGNLNFKHTFKDSVGTRELTADADYARYDTRRLQYLTTYQDREPVELLTRRNGDQEGLLTIQSIKADYTHPLTKKARLDLGGKVSWVHSDNDVEFTIPFVDPASGAVSLDYLVRDANLSNRFRYDENINAGYVNYNQTLPGWTLQLGLRGEQTKGVGKSDNATEDANFNRNYFQLFPSAAVKHTFTEQHETSVSLSRRIDRPGYGQLNPFRSYIDATTYGAGNPRLKPQTSYNVELTHTYKQKYSLGLSYSRTSDPIVGTVQPENANSRIVVSTSQNLGTQYYYALTLTAPVELAKWWNVYNNGVLYYNRYVGSIAGTTLDRSSARPAFSLSSNSTFTFGKGWSADLNANYQSRELSGFFDTRPYGQVAFGIQKSLWERKANLKLNVTDAFYTGAIRATSTYDNYVERFYQRGDFRVATLAFSYRFGNDKLAPARRRSGGAEDEKRRAGGS
ncbi:TonB-dependent receptor domain-containing protein [Hymenobacter chitinivorans]|uniref:Outer membrane receptor protein involved in Fe transport n=1 Tax=Hymenobacter chitinivorans DSM 11115 TaxID=1121954 RepID=A0A2M9BQK7_9BACT|nr:TonB-dependent receptor [Hymenobacter chitinivorans]PJJ60182.1 outer membrane receptor protein involved in Fe transport [Hymenobacter chitinivorans DSM 11115]